MSISPTSMDADSSSSKAEEGTSPVDVTPIASLLALPQSDDAGAQTADRYEWQAAMASADALALHFQFLNGEFNELDPSQIQIICEFHEDWVVQIGANAELVSAKHRDPQIGPWKTATDLVDSGGLAHLFSRWLNAGRLPTARLVTNAATASGPAGYIARCRERLEKQSKGVPLTENEAQECSDAIDAFCRSVMKYAKGLPVEWAASEGAQLRDFVVPKSLLDAGSQFLRILRIDQQRPSRSHTAHTAPSLYAEPVAKKIGIDRSVAVPIWETVLSLLRIRMRARGENERGGLPVVGGTKDGLFEEELNDGRAVSVDDLQIALETCVRHPKAYATITLPQRLTRLSMKMAKGDCSDTSIERAEQLRLDYSRYRRERRNAVPGSIIDLRNVEGILHRFADEETLAVRTPHEEWGSLLWSGLSSRLSNGTHELAGYGLQGDLGLGGVCQLAQDCKVWFSGSFDVDEAIAAAKSEKGAGSGP